MNDPAIKEYDNPYGFEGQLTPRRALRHMALSLMARGWRASGNMNYWLNRNRIQFLYSHHLFPQDEVGFRRLLKYLSRTHQLLSYSAAVQRLRSGPIDRPYVCISFDDGLRQSLRAAEILQEFGVTGCFFICPGLVGVHDSRKLKEICATRFSMPPTELLTWAEVEALARAGHEIGSHTMTHRIIAQLPAQEIAEEVGQSYDVLRQRLGAVQHFAWPEGRDFHFNEVAARVVTEVGFQSRASAERGCHLNPLTAPTDVPCLRRDYVSAHWPLEHVLYFLARNSRMAAVS